MTVSVHHLNCGTLRPYGLFPLSTIPLNGSGRLFRRGLGVIHCLLIDTGERLILVDSGYGTSDYTNPTKVVRVFNKIIGLAGDIEESACRQIAALGKDPARVSDIFLTHMHLDHTGGLPDFPHARVHVFEAEYRQAMSGEGIVSAFYIDQHWGHDVDWQLHRLEGERWQGLEITPPVTLDGIQFFLSPMVGHSQGHCIVIMRLPDGRTIIHAGDAYAHRGQLAPEPFAPPLQWLFRPLINLQPITHAMFQYDGELRRLRRELGDGLQIFNAHDPFEFEQLSGQKLG